MGPWSWIILFTVPKLLFAGLFFIQSEMSTPKTLIADRMKLKTLGVGNNIFLTRDIRLVVHEPKYESPPTSHRQSQIAISILWIAKLLAAGSQTWEAMGINSSLGLPQFFCCWSFQSKMRVELVDYVKILVCLAIIWLHFNNYIIFKNI